MRTLLLALGLVMAALPAGGQQLQPLTLDEARRLSGENNPALQRAYNGIVTARAGELSSRAAFLPGLNLSFNSGGSLSRNFTGIDEYGKPVRRDDPLEYTGSNSSQSIGLSMQLFDGGQRLWNARAATAGREAVVAAAEDAASAMEAELARRYYSAQQATDLIRLEEALLKAAEDRFISTERLLRVASGSAVDLLGAEIDVQRQRQAVESARGEARKAMLLLAEQMGVETVEGWDLVTEMPVIFDPTGLDADSLVSRAYEVSPRLRQQTAIAEQAQQQRRAAAATRWPSLSANTGFSRSIGSEGYGSLFEPNPANQGFSFGFSVSVPLLAQYQTSQQITQARMRAEDAGITARETQLQLSRLVRSALIDLESAYRTVELADANIELSRRQLDYANQRFRLGSTSFTELQQIIASAAMAEREALRARYLFATALATLHEIVGAGEE